MPAYQQKGGVGGPDDKPGARAQSDGPGHRGGTGRRKREVRSRIFKELVLIAAEQGASIPLGISTGEALQQCLDRAVALWRFAASQVDKLEIADDPNCSASEDDFFEVVDNPQGPDVVTPNRWYVMEREARLEIEKLASMMTQLGIAERVVRVEEAKAALLVAAVRDACMEAGIDHDQVKLIGAKLREKIEAGMQSRQNPRGKIAATAEAAKTMRGHENGDGS